MAKKELTISEFREIIREEAIKLKKRIVLENEKKTLEKELKSLMSESYVEKEDEIDEADLGMMGRLFNHKGSIEGEINKKAKEFGITPTPEQFSNLFSKIKSSKTGGEIKVKNGELYYREGKFAPHGAGAPGGGFSNNV